MKQIIWIFGTSTAGKNTFVHRVCSDQRLRELLGWGSRKVAASTASLTYIGSTKDDPFVAARDNIFTEVPALLLNNDCVLIKWQFVDSEANRLERLKAAIPEAEHSIICLSAPIEELIERVKTRPSWKGTVDERAYMAWEKGAVGAALEQMASYFPIEYRDSSSSGQYQVTNEQ